MSYNRMGHCDKQSNPLNKSPGRVDTHQLIYRALGSIMLSREQNLCDKIPQDKEKEQLGTTPFASGHSSGTYAMPSGHSRSPQVQSSEKFSL